MAGLVAAAALVMAGTTAASGAGAEGSHAGGKQTATPIKHLVVIFQENVSFDHYFGTYPMAANTDGQPFYAAPDTPTVNGLGPALLNANPNLSNPQRLSPAEAATCDQDHGYSDEQKASDNGLMDQFVQNTGHSMTLQQCLTAEGNPTPATGTSPNYAVMDYYDGNTVTALWNYAQHFAMSDNSYGTNFGPSTSGAVNVTSGNTYGTICGPATAVYGSTACTAPTVTTTSTITPTPGSPQAAGTGTIYSDADPYYDVCSNSQDGHSASSDIQQGGLNIGDLLNQKNITWGWFQGGFASPGYVPGQPSTDNVSTVCTGSHTNILGNSIKDYSPHHEPFQYYQSTANPLHLPPTSISAIGHQDQANHQYDLSDFWAAADGGHLPAVSYLKAAEYQDGHAGYSDPIDEQNFLVNTINRLESLPSWSSTAVVINYDDSDGWYDHQLAPVVMQSQTPLDSLTGTEPAAVGTYSGQCGTNPARVPMSASNTPEQARCGYGPRLPLLVISPYSRSNFVDHSLLDQSSIVRFIEDNWLGGQRIGDGGADALAGSIVGMLSFQGHSSGPLYLNPVTGEPGGHGHHGR